MRWFRNHWYDLAGVLAITGSAAVFIYRNQVSHYQLLMWISLVTLFFHQWEEYRIASTFPGMVNKVMYHSKMPDRFPLNTRTAFIINVCIGWTAYFLAALLAEKAVWLGIATMIVSIGNIIAHTGVFNVKGKTLYNAGMVTCLLLFIPCTSYFFYIIHSSHLVHLTDYLIGVPLGVIINIVGIVKLISWLGDKETEFVFSNRHLLPGDRK